MADCVSEQDEPNWLPERARWSDLVRCVPERKMFSEAGLLADLEPSQHGAPIQIC